MQAGKNKQVFRQFTRLFKNRHIVDGGVHLLDRNFADHFREPLSAGFEGPNPFTVGVGCL